MTERQGTPPRKRLLIRTWGCQMNVYDSARMADVLAPLGYAPTEVAEEADMVILNTCHIREKATEKVFSDLGRLREAKAARGGEIIVAVGGCVAQAEGAEITARAAAEAQWEQQRADLVAAFVRHGEFPVKRILDVGCGLGLMRGALLEHFPKASYTGLEVSDYLCRTYGWVQGSAATFTSPQPFDLVVCYDVLQYLTAREAGAALRNLATLCAGVLHFGVLTTEDWELYCDRTNTDRNVHIRPGSWYRRRLAPAFINAGSGMFVRRGAPIHLWELDQVEVLRSRRAG